jgi:hypothetical protein
MFRANGRSRSRSNNAVGTNRASSSLKARPFCAPFDSLAAVGQLESLSLRA